MPAAITPPDFDDLLPTDPIPGDRQTLPAAMVLPAGWIVVERGDSTGDNSNHSLRIVNDGLITSGDVGLFGATGSNERALGSMASGSLAAVYGAVFVNDTETTLNTFTLRYTGEQWKDGRSATAVQNTLEFSDAINANAMDDGAFTRVEALDFAAPIGGPNPQTGSDVLLDGNDPANQVLVGGVDGHTVSGLTWLPDDTRWIRWEDINDPGNDDALPMDSPYFTASSITDPGLVVSESGGSNDHVYSPAFLTQSSDTPDAATRIVGNLDAESTAAWYNGGIENVLGSGFDLNYRADQASTNLPAGALLTPGADNYEAPINVNLMIVDDYFSLSADASLNVLNNDTMGLEVQTLSAMNVEGDKATANRGANTADNYIPDRPGQPGVPQRSVFEGAMTLWRPQQNYGDIDVYVDLDADPSNDDDQFTLRSINVTDGMVIGTLMDNSPLNAADDPPGDPANTNLAVVQYTWDNTTLQTWIATNASPENRGEQAADFSAAYFPYAAG